MPKLKECNRGNSNRNSFKRVKKPDGTSTSYVDGIALGTRTRRVGVRQEPECCGLATAGAEIGRPAYIVACRRRSADGIVTFSGRDSDLELASSLSGCTFVSQVSGAICSIADARKVFTDPAEIPCPPRCVRSVCPAFQRLSFGGLPCDNRQSRPPVLIHSCNHYPLGNCDSPRPETSLNYLIRLGAAS
jgi:hypothetical protein